MRLHWNREFGEREARTFCQVDPGGDGGNSGPSGSPAASPSAPAAAPSSGSTSGSGVGSSVASPASAPAPSVAPGTTPSTSPVDATGGDNFDFESIFGDGPESEPEPKPVAPLAPPPAAATPQPAQAQPAQQPATTQPTQQPSTGGQPATSVLDASDPASIAHHLNLHKDAAIAHIAEHMFKLSPEDVEALETDTVGTIPKLLSRTFVEMQSVMLGQMARLVPQIVQRHGTATAANAEAERAFYSMWPGLDQSKHGDLVRRYAVTYRQMHPQATREQMFSDLGPIVMMAARVAPTAPSVQRNSPKPSPFVPAGGGVAEPNNSPGLSPIEAMFLHND